MKAKILHKEVISNDWAEYARYTVEYERTDGGLEIQTREIHNSGNGAAVFLYNQEKQTVLLVKQFRLAALVNEHLTGILVEVCAGLVENNDPRSTIIHEVAEEIGLTIENPEFLFSAYATPGAKTEKIHFFASSYPHDFIPSSNGGLSSEQEDIEILEIPYSTAVEWIYTGEIMDAKTIILLLYGSRYMNKY